MVEGRVWVFTIWIEARHEDHSKQERVVWECAGAMWDLVMELSRHWVLLLMLLKDGSISTGQSPLASTCWQVSLTFYLLGRTDLSLNYGKVLLLSGSDTASVAPSEEENKDLSSHQQSLVARGQFRSETRDGGLHSLLP